MRRINLKPFTDWKVILTEKSVKFHGFLYIEGSYYNSFRKVESILIPTEKRCLKIKTTQKQGRIQEGGLGGKPPPFFGVV